MLQVERRLPIALQRRPSLLELMPEGYVAHTDKFVNYAGRRDATLFASKEGRPDIFLGNVQVLKDMDNTLYRRCIRSRFENRVVYSR